MIRINVLLTFLVLGSLLVLAKSQAVEINEDNWEGLLSNGEWMVEFFAPWCPACNRFQGPWNELAQRASELKIRVGAADVNANPVLSGLFSVTSLPTIYHIKDGQYRIYHGNREIANLVDFVKNEEWKKIEPSSSWFSPNSFLIKALSMLFKLTIYFKDIYTKLTEHYGYPVWAVLTLFVIITIFLGLLLGVLFIIMIDCVCPPKRPSSEDLKELPGDDVLDEDEDKDKDEAKVKGEKSDKSDAKQKKKAAKKDN